MNNSYFIITIDTEGDNLWRKMYSKNSIERITHKNGKYIERFQTLCEKYKFKPTYLVNYEMSLSKELVELSKSKEHSCKMEIGMHMHAWNCPPFYDLERNRIRRSCNPYIGEYPLEIIDKKVDFLTKQLEETFERDIKSHRSGRWFLNGDYLQILKKYGYIVDCTVTPGISWAKETGQTQGSKGTDYRKYQKNKYEIDLNNIRKRGKSGFFEVPVTIENNNWLRPNGANLDNMKKIVELRTQQKAEYIEFMLHSSELMPYGSPTFRTDFAIEKLYFDLEKLFEYIQKEYKGATLNEYVWNSR